MFCCDELAQEQKSPTSISGEMNAKHVYNSVGVHKPLLNKVKASGGCHRFLKEFLEQAREKSGRTVFCDELAQDQ